MNVYIKGVKFMSFAKVVPAQYSLTVQNRGVKHQSFHFILHELYDAYYRPLIPVCPFVHVKGNFEFNLTWANETRLSPAQYSLNSVESWSKTPIIPSFNSTWLAFSLGLYYETIDM